MMTEDQLKEKLIKALAENENNKLEDSPSQESESSAIFVLHKTFNYFISNRRTKKLKGFKRLIASLSILVLFIAGSYSLANDYTPPLIALPNIEILSDQPMGTISFPGAGSDVDRHFQIIGETRNILPDRKIVLAVDVERLRLCWPKKPFIQPNTKFKINFYEGGPVGEFTVSMYAVSPTYIDNVTEWLDNEIFGGLPLIPNRYHLYSKTFNIKQ